MGSLVGKLYQLDCKMTKPKHTSFAAHNQQEESADLWHQRLGHVNKQQLYDFGDVAIGVRISNSSDLSFCEQCVEGKMQRKPFKPVGEIRSTRKLERIHSDVCGPMSTESFGGQKYFVTFIDDFSRYCKVYFMRHN